MGQIMPLPRGAVIGPGDPLTRGTGGHLAKLGLHSNHRPPFSPAQIKEEPQFLAEGGVQTAVDEWVIAGGAHSQPVKAEVKCVRGVDGVAGEQHHIAVQREPAHSKNPDHQEQHG